MAQAKQSKNCSRWGRGTENARVNEVESFRMVSKNRFDRWGLGEGVASSKRASGILYLIAFSFFSVLFGSASRSFAEEALETKPEWDKIDRTTAFIPLPAATDPKTLSPLVDASGKPSRKTANVAARSGSPNAADQIWNAYIELWRAHRESPSDSRIRGLFGLPADADVMITQRRGRVAPNLLDWRPGSFRVWQTDHFEILSRASDLESKRVAEALEREYWVWTQVFFPVWEGRDQIALLAKDWNLDTTTASEHLATLSPRTRLKSRGRHRVVLLADANQYRATIQNAFQETDAAAVAASTGFYSDTQRMSFFFPARDLATLHHEVCHQLFTEASAHATRRRPNSNLALPTATTKDFWLIEGIAGYMESLRYADGLAFVGGWESPRLQLARYQALIAGVPIATLEELRGTRNKIQSQPDLSRWYSQSSLHTHHLMDVAGTDARRDLLKYLVDLYSNRLDASSETDAMIRRFSEEVCSPAQVQRSLRVDDAHLLSNPIDGAIGTLCLAGCEISQSGLAHQPSLSGLTWCDLSRLPVGDADVRRLISDTVVMDQLSLEATGVTSQVGELLRGTTEMRELDLSFTHVDDAIGDALPQSITTLWLSGSEVTDALVPSLIAMPKLKTLDVQRTGITETGLNQLRKANPNLQLNPLRFAVPNQ